MLYLLLFSLSNSHLHLQQNRFRTNTKLPNRKSGRVQKWTTLVHNGLLFPCCYKPHGVKMMYDGIPVDLTPEQEEVATLYAKLLNKHYVNNEQFNENFFNDWKQLLGRDHVIQDLKMCDFNPIYHWKLQEKENMSFEVNLYKLRPTELYYRPGIHFGKLIKRVFPSDITINIGKDAPIPEHYFRGESWKEVRHDNTVCWIACWSNSVFPNARIYCVKSTEARESKGHTVFEELDFATRFTHSLTLRAGNDKDDDMADIVEC